MEKRSEGLVLTELASGVTLSDVMESIDAELIISISLAQEQRGPSKR
jgi:acyl CoA:acetate/3-ketoacid CoA transferase